MIMTMMITSPARYALFYPVSRAGQNKDSNAVARAKTPRGENPAPDFRRAGKSACASASKQGLNPFCVVGVVVHQTSNDKIKTITFHSAVKTTIFINDKLTENNYQNKKTEGCEP